MLFKRLHYKLVLIFVLFIIIVMSVVCAIMLYSVFNFFTNDFRQQMEETFGEQLMSDLRSAMGNDEYASVQKNILQAYSGQLGIDNNRHFYILDENGVMLAGTNEELGKNLIKTPNMLAAMNGRIGSSQILGFDYMDYAVPVIYTLSGESGAVQKTCIIYIKDSQERMRNFFLTIFSIIIQSLLIGLIIAVVLSFFLAKAITSPIQNITRSTIDISRGDFGKKIEISSDDEIGTLASTFNDMSRALKNTIEDVSSEREKLHTIFLYLKDGVLAFSANESLLHINPQGINILGEGFGYENTFSDFTDLLHIQIDRGELFGKIGTGLVFRDVPHLDHVIDVYVDMFKYKQDDNVVEGIIAVINDITQRYSLEKSRREFIANVSHELRTPLTSIKGAAETILENPTLAEQIKENFLNMILDESDRMTRIVKDLLVISRIDNKKVVWSFDIVNAGKLAQNVSDVMAMETKAHSHTLNLNIQEGAGDIYADKGRIMQVFVNILSNAVKYTPDGGIIDFSVKRYPSNASLEEYTGVKFVVRDSGIGIPPDDLPHVFDRFYRVEKARSTETGGTGLGLAIAQEYVLAHNGRIDISSEPGKGTAVTIILPAAPKDMGGEPLT